MKKKGKGRVAGTIGWILAVSLCLGTVGFGTYKCVNGVIGSSTGNAILSRFNQDALDTAETETKKLLMETAATYSGSTEGATYASYTMEYSLTATVLADVAITLGDVSEQEVVSTVIKANGVFRVNNDYTYEKTNVTLIEDTTLTNYVSERYLVKETGEWYKRVNTFYGESASDMMLLDSAEWQKDSVEILSEEDLFTNVYISGDQVAASFLPLLTEQLEFSVIDAEFTYVPQYSQEFLEENNVSELTERYGFKPGRRPAFFAQSHMVMQTQDSGEGYSSSIYTKMNSNETLVYSNLNNTRVELPASLQSFITSEAEVTA
ncbi:MAG: hypothetical protein IJV80_00360 [Clostridia bacterium]|nr:hypothetical protein [Clostridia bacterium]